MKTCDGWERLSHEANEDELTKVGSHSNLCKDCYSRFEKDPMKDDLLRFL